MSHRVGSGTTGNGRRARRRPSWRAGVLGAVLVMVMAATATVPVNADHGGSELPWEQLTTGGINPAAVGQGFNLNEADLLFIGEQILIADQHAATATPANPCSTMIGNGPNQIPGPNAHLQPLGLRSIDGTCNNLVATQDGFGAADREFPRLTTPVYRTDYAPPFTTAVVDPEPRRISNIIVEQTASNPAAMAAWDGVTTDGDGTLVIPNVAPDEGLSAPFNTVFPLFGQFFDHGLDLTTKTGETVTFPLDGDDPLFPLPAFTPEMSLSRASNTLGEPVNRTTPFVDQQQTYASHPSVHVFLREYELDGSGEPVSTGHMLRTDYGPAVGDFGMANWAEVKSSAATFLGIKLVDNDVHNAPLLQTDPYGRFQRGPNGFPLIVLSGGGVLEGDPTANGNTGVELPVDTVRTEHGFLVDIAHDSNPPQPGAAANGHDSAKLGRHFVAGDGRVNENIGLSAIHHVFHSEHNRLVGHIKDVLEDPSSDPANLPFWQLSPGVWNGERLLQAARFVTEMEYQHLAFEEFARKVQPDINVFDTYNADIDPAITVEYSQAAYRFGHSMLRDTLLRYDTPPFATPNDIPLLTAFLNPDAFFDGAPLGPGGLTLSPDEGAGSLFRGAVTQDGNEIDGFVLDTLRSNLVGLPLDLASINIARGRDYGIPPLNEVRRQLFNTPGTTATGNIALQPYVNWLAFALKLNNPGAADPPPQLSNFIAAYGTHATVIGATTIAGKRAAADAILVDAMTPGSDGEAFLNSTGIYANGPGGVTTTGVDDIDLWMGGLAEENQIAGGMLGDTFDYIFKTQLEALQEGDRFYYLARTGGMNLLVQLEGNSFSELIERNTSAGNLPADVFSRPNFTFFMEFHGSTPGDPIVDNPATPDYDESLLLTRDVDGTVRFAGGEHTNFVGDDSAVMGEGDRIAAGDGDDTVRGNAGDDRLDGGDGGDNIIGGDGNDIITDPTGDEDVKGGDGHDAINAGNGFDLLQGGRGNDFITGSTTPKEILAGPGNDLILGGDSTDEVHGDDGDDWGEGGLQSDNLEGDSGLPLILGNDVNEPGNDVLNGNGGDDRLFGEGGNDILVLNSGVERAFGQMGHDFATHYNDPLPGASDLANNALVVPGLDVFDRFLTVEGLSGWDFDDVLAGDDAVQADLLGHELDAAGIANIDGLAAVLPPGTTLFDTGNIIMGGRGSDSLEGRGGDDVIDGDAWLTVQLMAPPPGGGLGMQLVDSLTSLQVDLMAGNFNGGDISIVRTIETDPCPTCTDTAVFSGPIADYDIVTSGGTTTVNHARGDGLSGVATLDNGTDFLRNIEFAQFADATVSLVPGGQDILMSFTTSNVTLPGVGAVADEDIVSFDPGTGQFALVFDGAANGVLAGEDIDGFAVLPGGNIVMSFNSPAVLPGIPGTVDDSDIVEHDGASFSMFLDGSAVGLTTGNEDVDAVELLTDGRLLVSTIGTASVPGASALDEDLLAFTPTVPGDFSAGTWALHFDGSAVGLTATGEDVDGAYVDGADLGLTTVAGFSVTGLSGANEDIFSCNAYMSPPPTSCAAGFSSIVDGTVIGLPANTAIDGIDVVGDPTPPPSPTVSVDDVSMLEGNGGVTPFVFTVSLDVAPTIPVTITVATADGTATIADNDYTAVPATILTWTPGVEPLMQTVTVNVNGDTDLEIDQNFFVDLTLPTGDLTIADAQGEGTIVDDDAIQVPAVSIDDVSLPEGDVGVTPFVFNVSLDVPPTVPVMITVATADGSAIAPGDYAAVLPTVVTFNTGVTSQTVTVNVNGDLSNETPDETFFVNLTSPVGVTIADNQGLGTIENDDLAPTGDTVFMSFTANVLVPGLGTVADEDIVALDLGTGLFAMEFDGSANGIPAAADINGYAVLPGGNVLMSFMAPLSIPGIGPVDDSDIVEFDGAAFSMFFDGSLVLLTNNNEDIDAFELLDDGTLLLSTVGNPTVGIAARDEDVLSFTPATPFVDYTTGTYAMYLDASGVGLAAGGEDISGVYMNGPDLALVTLGNFSVSGASGANEDVFSCDGIVPGPISSCTGFSVIFDGSIVGLPTSAAIDAIEFG